MLIIFFTPSVKTLIKLNILGMKLMGDMNWQQRRIRTYPIQTAVRYNIPLMFWGEHGRSDVGGMFSHNDFIEFTTDILNMVVDTVGKMIEGKKLGIEFNSNQLNPFKFR